MVKLAIITSLAFAHLTLLSVGAPVPTNCKRGGDPNAINPFLGLFIGAGIGACFGGGVYAAGRMAMRHDTSEHQPLLPQHEPARKPKDGTPPQHQSAQDGNQANPEESTQPQQPAPGAGLD